MDIIGDICKSYGDQVVALREEKSQLMLLNGKLAKELKEREAEVGKLRYELQKLYLQQPKPVDWSDVEWPQLSENIKYRVTFTGGSECL